jgi:hypothetical protein
MGLLGVSDALDSDDMLAINTDQRGKTRIDRCMVNAFRCWVELRNHLPSYGQHRRSRLWTIRGTNNSASATSALGAAKFGASKPNAAEILQKSDFWIRQFQNNLGAVEEELKRVIVGFYDLRQSPS